MPGEFSIDPGLSLTARWIVAFIFASAAWHKLQAPRVFTATLENYRLLPSALLVPVAVLVIAGEIFATVGLVAGIGTAGLVAAGLLSLYTAAIAVNLIRGRRDIDCGCSGITIRQTLSPWLLVRNLGLFAVALLTLPPNTPRPLGPLDWFTTVAVIITFALIYSAATYLFANQARFGR